MSALSPDRIAQLATLVAKSARGKSVRPQHAVDDVLRKEGVSLEHRSTVLAECGRRGRSKKKPEMAPGLSITMEQAQREAWEIQQQRGGDPDD